MAKIKVINDDAFNVKNIKADIIFTDPPFDLNGDSLCEIFNNIESNHLILITTMKQLIELIKYSKWQLAFDFVLDAVVPKKSKNVQQPNYTHQTGVYLTRNNAKSLFNRKKRQRSDTFDNNGYWPTILRAQRERLREHGMAKNLVAVTDILGSFEINSVCDPFAGSGTVGVAAFDLGIDCTLVEKEKNYYHDIISTLKFLGAKV